jgi:hypothetical protein
MSSPAGTFPSAKADVGRRGRSTTGGSRPAFYLGMVVALTFTVFLGFSPSFYLRHYLAPRIGLPALPSTLVIVHGMVFTSWMLLLLAQTLLVRAGDIRLHRRLGVAGATIATLMVILGIAAQIGQTHRNVVGVLTEPDRILENSLTIGAIAGIVVFGGLVAAAIRLRSRPDVHRRLMLLATTILVAAATGRIIGMLSDLVPAFAPFAPIGAALLPDTFIIAIVVYDIITVRRLHSATLWGALPILALQAVSFTPFYESAAATAFTRAVAAIAI